MAVNLLIIHINGITEVLLKSSEKLGLFLVIKRSCVAPEGNSGRSYTRVYLVFQWKAFLFSLLKIGMLFCFTNVSNKIFYLHLL